MSGVHRVATFARACALLAAALCAPAHAQEFPSKQITVFMVLAAGTGLDAVARTWGEQLAQALGKPVVFDNRPGAGGIIAVTALKNQPADGHALLVATSAAFALNQMTYKQLPYNPQELFPVSIYLKSPFILVVHPSLPVKSAIVNRLHAEMARIMKTPDVRQRVAGIGLIPIDPLGIEEDQQYVASETKKWGDLIRSLGLAGSL